MSEPVEVIDAPPLHHGRDFVGDLDVSQILVTPQRALLWAPVTDSIRSESGPVSVGLLATFLDVIASMPTIAACAGDWSATQTLGLHASGWLVEGPVVVDASLARVGKKAVVVAGPGARPRFRRPGARHGDRDPAGPSLLSADRPHR